MTGAQRQVAFIGITVARYPLKYYYREQEGGDRLIASFGDKVTEAIFHGTPVRLIKRFPADVRDRAIRKLDMLNAARDVADFLLSPGNHLEELKADLKGFHSIRVNDQWRLVFRWEKAQAYQVRLIDYH